MKDNKFYSSHGKPMSFVDFIAIEVVERGNYRCSQVIQWAVDNDIGPNTKVIWVNPNINIANSYNYLAQDRALVISGKHVDKFPIDVHTFTKRDGFILEESKDGDDGYLMILRKEV